MDLSYRGTSFHGWQIQPNGETVQEVLEKALTMMLKEDINVIGSGRTDTGVHARQQIAHFETAEAIDATKLSEKLNSYLPQELSINWIKAVNDEAHARFSATSRTYHYRINQHKDPFKQGLSYYFRPELNIPEINKACKILMDWENFECFSKVHTEVNHFRCDVKVALWTKIESEHLFVITADRFLRGMVRAIVGTLIDVGLEKISLEEFQLILESNDRSRAGRAVPPEGLYLQEVTYPKDIYNLD